MFREVNSYYNLMPHRSSQLCHSGFVQSLKTSIQSQIKSSLTYRTDQYDAQVHDKYTETVLQTCTKDAFENQAKHRNK